MDFYPTSTEYTGCNITDGYASPDWTGLDSKEVYHVCVIL